MRAHPKGWQRQARRPRGSCSNVATWKPSNLTSPDWPPTPTRRLKRRSSWTRTKVLGTSRKISRIERWSGCGTNRGTAIRTCTPNGSARSSRDGLAGRKGGGRRARVELPHPGARPGGAARARYVAFIRLLRGGRATDRNSVSGRAARSGVSVAGGRDLERDGRGGIGRRVPGDTSRSNRYRLRGAGRDARGRQGPGKRLDSRHRRGLLPVFRDRPPRPSGREPQCRPASNFLQGLRAWRGTRRIPARGAGRGGETPGDASPVRRPGAHRGRPRNGPRVGRTSRPKSVPASRRSETGCSPRWLGTRPGELTRAARTSSWYEPRMPRPPGGLFSTAGSSSVVRTTCPGLEGCLRVSVGTPDGERRFSEGGLRLGGTRCRTGAGRQG